MVKVNGAKAVKDMPEDMAYCRKCQKIMTHKNFLSALDKTVDSNGRLSICRVCTEDLFEIFMNQTNSLELAVLKMCKLLNFKYDERAISSTKLHLESTGGDPKSFMGLYKGKLLVLNRTRSRESFDDLSLEYKDNPQVTIVKNFTGEQPVEEETPIQKDVASFWGVDDKNDLEFLEREFSNFKRTHKADTYAEVVLMREVCQKMLAIDKNRKAGLNTDSDLKQLMDIMKNLAISPNSANASSSDVSADTFGLWIKDIENLTPAEWLEDKGIYSDVDGIEKYFEKFIVSPIRSLITGVKEFSLDGGTDDTEEMEE